MVAVAVHIVVLNRVLMAGLVVVDRRVTQEGREILHQLLLLKVIMAEMGVVLVRILVLEAAAGLVGQERLEPLRLVVLVVLEL
jgi:hypothetical protein